MFFLKSVFCRMFQTVFRLAMPILPYREPKIIGSCAEINKIIDKEGITSALIVTDKGIVKNGLLRPVVESMEFTANTYCHSYNCRNRK